MYRSRWRTCSAGPRPCSSTRSWSRPGEQLTREEVLAFLEDRVAKWWLPDDVVFVEEIPKASVGKFSKKDLRDKFAGYELPTA